MTQDVNQWEGDTLYDSRGDKVGKIDAVYFDVETGEPEWATVSTGFFGTSSSFVPLRDARRTEDGVVTAYDSDRIKGAPRVEADGQLSDAEEARLYEHYGLSYTPYTGESYDSAGESYGDAGRGAGGRGDLTGGRGDVAMTRSEEEVDVGTREREAGRVRLRKYVETDTVTKTVPVRREKVRVEREPVDATDTDLVGDDLVDDQAEIVVREEEAVVDKRVVPKERVRLETDVEQDEVEVSEDVRRERFDIEGDGRADV